MAAARPAATVASSWAGGNNASGHTGRGYMMIESMLFVVVFVPVFAMLVNVGREL